MASKRLLIHSAVLHNYLGEVDNKAIYQQTMIEHCYCPLFSGTSLSKSGRDSTDTTRLYMFDVGTVWKNADGNPVSYLPFSEWEILEDKTGHWTISGDGNDYVIIDGVKMRIVQAIHRKNGSRRMWHWEVDCR